MELAEVPAEPASRAARRCTPRDTVRVRRVLLRERSPQELYEAAQGGCRPVPRGSSRHTPRGASNVSGLQHARSDQHGVERARAGTGPRILLRGPYAALHRGEPLVRRASHWESRRCELEWTGSRRGSSKAAGRMVGGALSPTTLALCPPGTLATSVSRFLGKVCFASHFGYSLLVEARLEHVGRSHQGEGPSIRAETCAEK